MDLCLIQRGWAGEVNRVGQSVSCILDDSVRSAAELKAYKSQGDVETPPLPPPPLGICSRYCPLLQQRSWSSKPDYKR